MSSVIAGSLTQHVASPSLRCLPIAIGDKGDKSDKGDGVLGDGVLALPEPSGRGALLDRGEGEQLVYVRGVVVPPRHLVGEVGLCRT
jgi:hypothetical protein